MMSIPGSDISPRAIASICCSPPEKVPAICRRRSFSLGNNLNTSLRHVVVVLLSLLLFATQPGQTPEASTSRFVQQGRIQYKPLQVLKEPTFWVMYVMFVLMAAGGLMATAQLKPIAKDFHLDTTPITLIGITLPALTFALTIDRVLNGLTRPFFGWVSDFLGRENTIFIVFLLEAVGIWALYVYGQNPLGFVLLSGLVFFAWGEIYS